MGAVIASATMFVTTLASSTEPDAVRTPDPDIVSPGFAGFLAVFCIAVATLFLIRSMTKHMRRAKFMAEQIEREREAGGDSAVQAPGQG
ncbi:hypothetical protein KIH74_16215 [Kineosporia sp. J2-2]|uniref:Uncharacterized protein n=1 Tax=Kineosporia corallincola TaxID=2835133 RepID=A0ABS5THC4_9ACTN|nr:hypothetical protein [Kineosporia corallincola]MBT0770490.1 hypothetical protein [Kineosporia corallincola]